MRFFELLQGVGSRPELFYFLTWLLPGVMAMAYLPPEAVLALVVLLMPDKDPLLVTLLVSLSSPIAFTFHYSLGRGAFSLSGKLKAAAKRLDPKRFKKSTFATMFLASSVSVPPFGPALVLCGMLGIPYRSVFLPALLGRTVRFAVVTLIVLFADQAGGSFGAWLQGIKVSLTGG